MTKTSMNRIIIEKLVYGGAGLGEINGKKIFVDFAAPGDELEIEITRDHGSFAEARMLRIIEPAPCRVTPACPVFGICGGCQWQHLNYAAQLEWKQKILAETFGHIGEISSANVLPTLPSPKEWNYRNRIQLHVDSSGHVGFYKPKSKEIVEFKRCLIADETLNEMLSKNRAEYAKRDRGVSLKLSDGPHFSQVNSLQNENVQDMVVEWIRNLPHEDVVELYAGSGNFTFPMAKIVGRIFATDIDGRAIRFASNRADEEGIKNIEFQCLPAGKILKRYKGECDLVFLDPPRKGADEAMDSIIRIGPKAILYMSCNPATLARDIKTLTSHGWSLIKSQPIDMFPQTFHIESLTLLGR